MVIQFKISRALPKFSIFFTLWHARFSRGAWLNERKNSSWCCSLRFSQSCEINVGPINKQLLILTTPGQFRQFNICQTMPNRSQPLISPQSQKLLRTTKKCLFQCGLALPTWSSACCSDSHRMPRQPVIAFSPSAPPAWTTKFPSKLSFERAQIAVVELDGCFIPEIGLQRSSWQMNFYSPSEMSNATFQNR